MAKAPDQLFLNRAPGGQRDGVGISDNWEMGILEAECTDGLGQAFLGSAHPRGMEGAAHRQRNCLPGAPGGCQVHRPSHRNLVPAYNHLVIGVDVGQFYPRFGTNLSESQLVKADNRRHAPRPVNGGLLHEPAPLPDQLHRIGEADNPGNHQ